MNPAEHCELEVAHPGSIHYYALLNASADSRPRYCACFALQRELMGLRSPQFGPEVKQAKLGWWASEVEHLIAGKPRHPVTQAMQLAHIPLQPVAQIIAGALADNVEQPASVPECRWYCEQTGGAIARLAASLSGACQQQSLDAAAHIGTAAQLLQWAAFVTSTTDESLHRELLDLAATLLTDAEHEVAGADRHALRVLLTLARLHTHAISSLHTDGRTMPLWTPLTRFWIAWRTHRQCR